MTDLRSDMDLPLELLKTSSVPRRYKPQQHVQVDLSDRSKPVRSSRLAHACRTNLLPDGIGISVVSLWASLEPECVFALLESRLPERGDICTGVSDPISALRHHPRIWGLEMYEFCLTRLKRHAGVILRAAGSCDAFDGARSKDDEKRKSVISNQ